MKIDFKKLGKWLIVSSENPENVALTVRGMLIAFIPVILGFAPTVVGLFGLHFSVSSEGLTQLFNDVSSFTQIILVMVGTALSGYGLIRKIVNEGYDIVTKPEVINTPVVQPETTIV